MKLVSIKQQHVCVCLLGIVVRDALDHQLVLLDLVEFFGLLGELTLLGLALNGLLVVFGLAFALGSCASAFRSWRWRRLLSLFLVLFGARSRRLDQRLGLARCCRLIVIGVLAVVVVVVVVVARIGRVCTLLFLLDSGLVFLLDDASSGRGRGAALCLFGRRRSHRVHVQLVVNGEQVQSGCFDKQKKKEIESVLWI